MAKTVAEIDGDSSGLVGALDKGKAGMKQMEASGKKLSDQLKDVADQADVAAGNIISKIGGPNAIKAIAGVGLAFEGASRLAGAFLDSSEALFRSYGDEGQKVWDDAEKSLFAIKGAFAEAVLGGGSMEDMGARLKTIFELVKIALDALFLPIKGLSTLVIALGEDFDGLSGFVIEASDSLDTLASKTRVDGLSKNAEGIEGLRIRLMGLKNETAELFKLEIQRDISKANSLKQDILATELQADAIASSAAVLGARGDIEKKANEARQAYIRDLGEEKLSVAQLAEARRIYSAEYTAQGQLVMAQQMKQREGVSAANQAQLDEVNAQIAEFQKLAATGPVTPAKTGGNKPKKEDDKPETPEEAMARLVAAAQAAVDAAIAENEAIAALKLSNDDLEKKNLLDRMKWEEEQRDIEFEKKKEALQRVTDFAKQMEDEAAAERKAKGILTAEEEDKLYQERKAKALQYVQDLAGQELGIYMQNAGKQLAIGKLSAKAAADMARSQLGNVIIGQGDEAMAKAGIMAAELNPLAIPMAAAGLAAYAIGNAMMPTAKPNAGSTPATEKPTDGGQAASNNYSFNMRVDSVFADGESVARQFAMMQESARQRGLLYQGA